MDRQNKHYQQVKLLVQTLPHIAKAQQFALKGGTALNLFIHNLPRLSVDIDLTYIPVNDRKTALKEINDSLSKIGRADRGPPDPPVDCVRPVLAAQAQQTVDQTRQRRAAAARANRRCRGQRVGVAVIQGIAARQRIVRIAARSLLTLRESGV